VSGQTQEPASVTAVPIEREAGWVPPPVWTFRREGNILLCRDSNPYRPSSNLVTTPSCHTRPCVQTSAADSTQLTCSVSTALKTGRRTLPVTGTCTPPCQKQEGQPLRSVPQASEVLIHTPCRIGHRGTRFSASQVALLNLRNDRSLVSLSFNTLNTMTAINYTLSPYRAVNILRLSYKNHPVNVV
jgi:hypothetical protein